MINGVASTPRLVDMSKDHARPRRATFSRLTWSSGEKRCSRHSLPCCGQSVSLEALSSGGVAVAGLVAAGEYPNPVEHADVVTTTVHKTLCGPRSGIILAREEYEKDFNRAVFPGQQGGPLMHVIAAKAVAFRIAKSEAFRARQRQTIENARALAEELIAGGAEVLTGGTDVHLVLVDLNPTGLEGQEGEDRLEAVGITVNRNSIPFDEKPPMNPSGLRIGTSALTTRGFDADDMREVGKVIAAALTADDFESEREALRERTRKRAAPFSVRPFQGDGLSPEFDGVGWEKYRDEIYRDRG
jgi:glycine hydroxymethyltransferase